jgi:hypothetical protein
MTRSTRYLLQRVEIAEQSERQNAWTLMHEPTTGLERVYAVTDRNLRSRNQWEFLVRTPNAPAKRVEVRPLSHPNLKAWAELEDRSLTFTRATRRRYRGFHYCQLALADPSGGRTKDVVHRGERRALPRWFRQLQSRLRLKRTVRPIRGNDGNEQVLIVRDHDYTTMVKLFFATKVWVLREGVVL